MPTSVHIPPALLEAVDKRARKLKISRNKLIVQALEKEVAPDDKGWPPGFFEQFTPLEGEDAKAADDMLKAIHANRRSRKKPPEF